MRLFKAIINSNKYYSTHRTTNKISHTILNDSDSGRFSGQPDYLDHRLKMFSEIKSKIDEAYEKVDKPKISIKLRDGKQIEGQAFLTTPHQITKKISRNLTETAIVAKVRYLHKIQSPLYFKISRIQIEDEFQSSDFQLLDMNRPLEGDCEIQFLTFEDKEGKQVFWHSSAHLLGQSLEKVYGAWLCHGPPLQNGFFYDCFMANQKVVQSDFQKLQKQVKNYINKKYPFERVIITKDQALQIFQYNPFKKKLVQAKVPNNGFASAYRCGDLIDLCTGPHVPATNFIKGFKITKNSSAYWLGNRNNDNLQRVYGISFPKQSLLDNHIKAQEQLRKRDHRTIGPKQQLFNFSPLSPGSALFYPHGTVIFNKLIDLLRSQYKIRGYHEVITPNIYNSELWKTSGHYYKYSQNIYWIRNQDEQFGLKPMNCPGHCLMFNMAQRSYKDLPIRYADFGVLHRNQLHGALSGLTRVRRFQQDDAHIFCMNQQIEEEILGVLDLIDYIYSVFGFKYSLQLSTRPDQYLGDIKQWNRAEEQLGEALKKFGKQYKINHGDGAFYGPKIDVKLFDAFGRQHQCGTVQLDFQLPQRFNLQFRTKDTHLNQHQEPQHQQQKKKKQNKEQIKSQSSTIGVETPDQNYNGVHPIKTGFARPVIIHRAIVGSLQRFIAILCEHTGGKWDFWISPRQLKIISLSKDLIQYCQSIQKVLVLQGYHIDVDKSNDKLEKKIRKSQLQGYNYIGVIGAKQLQQGTISLRKRGDQKPRGNFTIKQLISIFKNQQAPKSKKRIQVENSAFRI